MARRKKLKVTDPAPLSALFLLRLRTPSPPVPRGPEPEWELDETFSRSIEEEILYREEAALQQRELAKEQARKDEEENAKSQKAYHASEDRKALREIALSKPITEQQIRDFEKHLVPVHYGKGFCWLFGAKSSSGANASYGKLKFNGHWVAAHRFALAVKLGITPWELDGFWAGHGKVDKCVGTRCCNPDHLRKEIPPEGFWQRSKDRLKVGMKPERTKK